MGQWVDEVSEGIWIGHGNVEGVEDAVRRAEDAADTM